MPDTSSAVLTAAPAAAAPAGCDMVWIDAASFLMGSNEHYPEERPVVRTEVRTTGRSSG